MAVYTEVTSNIEYMLVGGNLGGCIGGGQDYRTMRKGTTTSDTLLIRAWAGDNISSACKLVGMSLENLETRIRNDSGNKPVGSDEYYVDLTLRAYKGSVSGTTFTPSEIVGETTQPRAIKSNNSSFETLSNYFGDFRNVAANEAYAAITIGLSTDISLSTTVRQIQLKNIRLTATRTRACYITFKGEGVTEMTTMYDYGTVPSFGSTPTRTGYVFKGWKSSADGVTYSGTLPTAYETDVTYTAVWNPTYTLTVTATAGGTVTGGGTYETGSSVTLKATPNTGYKFVKWSDGNTNATRTAIVTGDATYTAYFELDKINKIYIGTSQPKSLYVGVSQVKEIYRGTEKIYG